MQILLTRIITGVSGIALAAFIIMQGRWIYAAFAIILSLLAWHEYAAAFPMQANRLPIYSVFLPLHSLAAVHGLAIVRD